MTDDQESVEERKQRGLDKLLSAGWLREDLTWFSPTTVPLKRAKDPTRRTVHVYDAASQSFTKKVEELTQKQIERDERVICDMEKKRALGMWTIKHEAVMRRHREEIESLFEDARATLAGRWPEQAAMLHSLLTAYTLRHDKYLTKGDGRSLLDRVDQLAETLPPEAAEIARLAKLAYISDRKYQTELREACSRLRAKTRTRS